MNKLVMSLLFIGLTNGLFSFALNAEQAQNQPRVLFAAYNFYHPVHGSYVEFYLSFDASSLIHKKVDEYYQAKVQVLYIIKKNNKVVKYDKFELCGPKMDAPGFYQDFANIETITLPNGFYTVEVSITDMNSTAKSITAAQNLAVDLSGHELAMSDIIFEKEVVQSENETDPFVKNGYRMIPWLVSTIPSFLNKIYIYTEVYNADTKLGNSNAYIEKIELKNLDVDSVFTNYSSIKRIPAQKVNVILKSLDVSKLPSGSYIYTIEIYNRNNELVLSQGRHFYRESDVPSLSNGDRHLVAQDFETIINTQTNHDTVVEYFRSIRPLGDRIHQSFIDNHWNKSGMDILKAYIISFWTSYKPENTALEWLKYQKLVAVVNKEFGNGVIKGYDTDRGMIYLKYGPPDQIVVRENEPSSYPYSIWQYYQHPIQPNGMYVFYDPSLTYRDYQLLHSNVRGEKNNPRWRLILQSRDLPNTEIDREDGVDHWGGQVDEYYENPR